MKLRSSYLMSILVLGSLLVGVIGCGTPAPPPATEVRGEPTAAQPSPPAETPTPAPTPTEKPVIVIALGDDIDRIHPQEARSKSGYETVANLYEGPLYMKLEPGEGAFEGVLVGQPEYLPGMAESVEVDQENLIVRLKIKEGLKFANGNPITAHSFKMLWDIGWLMPTSYGKSFFPYVGIEDNDDVVAVDDYTLEFHLKRLTPATLALLAFTGQGAVDERSVEENATADDPFATEWLRRNANSSGPYMITEWDPGNQYVLEPNPNYWMGPDGYENSGVILKVVPEAENREMLLRAGDIDLAIYLPYGHVDDLDADPCCKVYKLPARRLYYFGMNADLPLAENKALRQAIAYAIPYDTIIDEVFYGYAQRATSPVPVGMPTHTDDFGYTTDLDMARQKLEEAGYANGVDVELAVRTSIPWDVEAATWIQSSLAEVGINVTINRMAAAEFYQSLTKRELPFFIYDWCSYINDPSYHLHFNLRTGSWANFVQYSNERVDELIDTAAWSLDPDVKEAGMHEAQQLIMDDAQYVPLYQPYRIIGVSEELYGMAVFDEELLHFRHMGKTSQ